MNVPLIQFSKTHSDKIKRLCRPLFEMFGFTDFWYARTTADGLHTAIETNVDYMESLCCDRNYLSCAEFTNPGSLNPGFYFYQDLRSSNEHFDDVIKQLGQKYKNIPYLGYVAKATKGEIIRFGYGINPQQPYNSSFIINNVELLKQFNHYFIANAFDLIKGAEQCSVDQGAIRLTLQLQFESPAPPGTTRRKMPLLG